MSCLASGVRRSMIANTGAGARVRDTEMLLAERSASKRRGAFQEARVTRRRPDGATSWPRGQCYCDLWSTSPATLEKQGVPRGYCGLCDVCGAPGHLLHFPGSVPFTGAWCKMHYYRAMILHPLGSVGVFLWGVSILTVIGTIVALLRARF